MSIPPVAHKKPREYEIHGMKFKDDYYWLRNKGADEVIKYLTLENEYTKDMMTPTEELQEKLFDEMKGRINEDDETVPIKFGEYYYYARNKEGLNYRIHCRKYQSLDAEEEIILDENKLAEGQNYLNIRALKMSCNHDFLAYTVDFAGDEIFDVHVVDLSSGDVIDNLSKVGSQLEWDSDETALFYTELDEIHREYALSRHVVGAAQSEDIRVFQEDDNTFMLFLQKSKDQSHILMYIAGYASETVELRYIDLGKAERTPTTFFPRTEGLEPVFEHHQGSFYILSNHENQYTYRLYKAHPSETRREKWNLLTNQTFETRWPSFHLFQNKAVILSRRGGYQNLSVFDIVSGELHDIEMPESIYAISLSFIVISDVFYFGNPEFNTDSFRFYFSSLVTPKSVYDYDMNSRELVLKKIDEIEDYDSSQYVTERRYAQACDGAKIPISLAYRKDLEITTQTPLQLYGYGSYGSPVDPAFDSKRLCLLERGMIFAIAHVRGGGEFGLKWYHQGKLKHKMNTFTDFITCAEYLIENKFTSSEKLCAWGGSAGGLLMGAIANLRPDLFGCIVASVPFVDVINTMMDDTIPLTTFEYKEWGNPNIKEEFYWMIEYSPYDNVVAKNYPQMLITAGYNDPRVQYWEPAKWVAKMRNLRTDDNQLLLKTKMETGHFSASGRYDYMKDYAFIYAFILDTFGLIDLS